MLRDPHWPFSPGRTPFFYGWVIVAASTLGVVASVPGQTIGVNVFNDDLIVATGLSRLELSGAYLLGTIASGLCLPLGGGLLDRFGARATALGASLGLAGTLLYLSKVDRIGHALGGGLLGWLVTSAGFLALRFCGQGMLTMVSRTMLGRWFHRRRGFVSGLSGIFVALAFGGAPLLFDGWIRRAGWRGAWQEMAVLVGLGMGLVALLFFRDDPESAGLRLDGDEPEAAPIEEATLTREQALRTGAFWAVTLPLATQALIITGITFHIVDIGAHAGLSRSEAVFVFLPVAVLSPLVGLAGGWLGDRIPVRALIAAMMLGQGLAIFAVADLDSRYALAVVGLGLSGGLFSPISTIAFPRFFGRRHLGAIAGVEMMCLVIGSALGPTLLAASEASAGSYEPALLGFLAVPLLAALAGLIWARPPTEPKPSSF